MRAVEVLATQMSETYSVLRGRLEGLTDDEFFWARPRMLDWGEPWPAWRIFTTMIDHDAHHGGEIGALRDLYRTSGPGAPQGAG